MMRRAGSLAGWIGLGAALAVTAYLLIMTTFMIYDDEGYVLHTLQAFLSGRRLYDEVFTQYGPAPFLYHQGVTLLLQQPLTHLLGRVLTGAHWVACALLCGRIVHRLTGATAPAFAAAIAVFGLLWQMTSEPSHPGSMIALLVAVAGCLVLELPAAARPGWLGAGLGAIGAALCLTKINVGLLFVAGLGCGALRFTHWPGPWARRAAIAGAAGLLLVPWGLMSQRLGDAWAQVFALQFTAAAAGLLWVTPAGWAAPKLPARTWRAAALAFLATALLICLVVLGRGTSARALLDAVLLSPVRHPARFMVGFTWVTAVWPVAVASWLLAARAGWELRARGDLTDVTRWLVIAARVAVFAAFVHQALPWLTIHGVGRFIVFCLPLLPLFVVPLVPRAALDPRRLAAGWLVALVAMTQVLHAFPIAGSQMGWGTFLVVPLLVAGLHEAWESLADDLPATGPWVARFAAGALLLVTLGQVGLLARTGWDRYTASRPLALPGAENLRVDGVTRLQLRMLTLNAAVHADLLYSRPGMFSFNRWSGVDTPTTRNATHWFWLLTPAEQTAIVRGLESTPRHAIIVNRALDEFVEKIRISLAGPLQDHLTTGYRTLFELGDFSFLVPAASRAVPFGKVELRAADPIAPGQPRTVMLTVNLVLEGRPATVALERLDPPWNVWQDYAPSAHRAYLEAITPNGDVIGAPVPLPADHDVRGLFRLTILSAREPRLGHPNEVGLFVRDDAHRVLADAAY